MGCMVNETWLQLLGPKAQLGPEQRHGLRTTIKAISLNPSTRHEEIWIHSLMKFYSPSWMACQTSIPDLSCHFRCYHIYVCIYIYNMYIMLFASIRCLSDNCTTSCIRKAGTTATQRSSSLPRPVTATLRTHFSSKWSKLFQDHL